MRDGERENKMQVCFAVKGFCEMGFINRSSGKYRVRNLPPIPYTACIAWVSYPQATFAERSFLGTSIHFKSIQIITTCRIEFIRILLHIVRDLILSHKSVLHCRGFHFTSEGLFNDYCLLLIKRISAKFHVRIPI